MNDPSSSTSRRRTTLVVIGVLALLVSGCASTKKKEFSPPDTTAGSGHNSADDRGTPAPSSAQDVAASGNAFEEATIGSNDLDPNATANDASALAGLQTVYFDYDSSELSATTTATLDANAAWLKTHGGTRVLVEGHCDERGSIEYNLALGARRASTVRDYLARLGVPLNQVEIVSKGEEEPVDRSGTDEAWAKNRRAEFKPVGR